MGLNGFIAGLFFANAVYQLFQTSILDKTEREVAININVVFTDSFVLLVAFCGYIFTVLNQSK